MSGLYLIILNMHLFPNLYHELCRDITGVVGSLIAILIIWRTRDFLFFFTIKRPKAFTKLQEEISAGENSLDNSI